MRKFAYAAAAIVAASLLAPVSAHAGLIFMAKSNWGCLVNSGGSAVLGKCNNSTTINMQYIPGENVFYGPLRMNGACLDIVNNQLRFAACNNSPSQTWKLSGNGQLNNSYSCVVGRGNQLAIMPCNQGGPGAWMSSDITLYSVPASASIPPGTLLKKTPQGLTNPAGQVVVTAASLVAAGGGNLVAAGGGNLIGMDGSTLVAAGGGNLVAAGGGNAVADAARAGAFGQ